MPKPKFSAGDIVEIKSGGPKMVVEQIFTSSGVLNDSNLYTCTWFAGAKHNSHRFNEEALKKFEEKQT